MFYNNTSSEIFLQELLFEYKNKPVNKNSITSNLDKFTLRIIKKIIYSPVTGLIRIFLLRIFNLFIIKLLFGIKVKSIKKSHKSKHPVIYVANHQSHLDAPAIALSLNYSDQKKIAVAAADDYFFKSWKQYLLITSILNIFPFYRRGLYKRNFDSIKNLINDGFSILIFPEGTRTRNGEMNTFKKGVGHIVKEMNIPVVPVKIENAYNLYPYNKKIPNRGEVDVKFGTEISFNEENITEIAEILENAVKKL